MTCYDITNTSQSNADQNIIMYLNSLFFPKHKNNIIGNKHSHFLRRQCYHFNLSIVGFIPPQVVRHHSHTH